MVDLQLLGRKIYGSEAEVPFAAKPKKTYWWIYGFVVDGKTGREKQVLLGAFLTTKFSEDDALEKGRMLEDARTFELGTKNQQKAKSEIRAILLEEGAAPDAVLRRMLHEKGVAREAGVR